MNHCVTAGITFPTPCVPRNTAGKRAGERETATDISNGAEKIPEGFEEVTEQMELPF